MAAPTVSLYKDTKDLVELYNDNVTWKQSFKRLLERPKVAFRGRSLKVYVWLISTLDKQYREYTQGTLDAERVDSLFEKFYLNKSAFTKLEHASSAQIPETITPEHQELEKIDTLPDSERKEKLFEQFVEKQEKKEQEQEQQSSPQLSSKDLENLVKEEPSIPRQTAPKEPPTFVKNLGSKAQIGTRSLGNSAVRGAGSMLRGAGGGALRGGGLLARGAVAGGGAIAGGVATGVAALAAVGWPVILGGIGLVIVMFFFFVMVQQNSFFTPFDQQVASAASELKISKTGPSSVGNGSDISYEITVTYNGSGKANVAVVDTIPIDTTFISASDGGTNSNPVKWVINNLAAGQSKKVTLTIRSNTNDVWISNSAKATVTNIVDIAQTGNVVGGSGLLPSTLLATVADWQTQKNNILAAINRHPNNIEAYKQASAATGVPWELLAGVHSVEGGSDPTHSLVSGRVIGQNEPDVVRSGGCSSQRTGPGIPIPVSGGCGFASLLDSAIYAANHLSQKIGHAPQNFQDAVTALSRYNGGGNRNCGRTPYTSCPAQFEGEDDPHPMSMFDVNHYPMYIVYCADLTLCSTPRLYQRIGVMAVVRALSGQ
jgi:hypothetical protein